jgi:redox-sensing transcriptional repressor
MSGPEISDVVIHRLPLYARALAILQAEGRQVVSSLELGQALAVTPAQIRKDLSYFGRFGKQGRGYDVQQLNDRLRAILGLDREWRLALVGVGRLGQAILGYRGFNPQGFTLVRAFDADPARIGQLLDGLTVEDVANLEPSLQSTPVDIGIVAVPAAGAQRVIDILVASGVHAILNYAPIVSRAPVGVHLRQIDPVLDLQSMTYYLKQRESEEDSPTFAGARRPRRNAKPRSRTARAPARGTSLQGRRR